jgi:hypothetical protein
MKRTTEDKQFYTKCYDTTIIVPKGFIFNGSNIPKGSKFFFGDPFDQYHQEPSLVHDFLYDRCSDVYLFSRKEADMVYYEQLLNQGYSKFKANIEYTGLRCFGWKYYKKRFTNIPGYCGTPAPDVKTFSKIIYPKMYLE